MSDNKTSSGTDWSAINWTSGTDTSFTVDAGKFKNNLEDIYVTYRKTEKEVNAGRKVRGCKRCSKSYYDDEGVSGGYCTLDCKYVQCIIEEDIDGKNL